MNLSAISALDMGTLKDQSPILRGLEKDWSASSLHF